MSLSPYAGKPAEPGMLTNIPRLVTAYYVNRPDPAVPAQRVAFGTSGHRGSSLDHAFNEAHILAITQAICLTASSRRSTGRCSWASIPTPCRSRPLPVPWRSWRPMASPSWSMRMGATRRHPWFPMPFCLQPRAPPRGLADGIVITPSHNPPKYGGFKYNPPHGGPADTQVTQWIESRANAFLAGGLQGVARVPFERARKASTTHPHRFLDAYVNDLPAVVDMQAIQDSQVSPGGGPVGRRQRGLL